MTKAAALYKFFSGFGIPAYPHTAVPGDAVFPWLTYEPVVGTFGDTPVSIVVNLWYYTDSESAPNGKAEEIGAALADGGALIPYDGGCIWLTRGSPWCQSLADDTDKTIKRRYLNLTADYIGK